MARCFKKHNITLSHKASNTIKTNVCQLKDRRTALETKNAIYKINCKNCDSVYIGESSKVVGDRVKEHSSNVRRRYQGSLIYKHSNETGHEFDFDNPKVLNSSKFTGTRKYLESFYSVADQNSINRFI